MSTIVRNILAVIAGVVLGGIVNMTIVNVGPALLPPPVGADLTSVEGLRAAMHLMEPKHFVSPFLAHALGTFVGALIAYLIAATNKRTLAFVVSVFFFIGGIAASFLIPAPAWFITLDLVVAYIPMAWLAAISGSMIQRGNRRREPV